MDSVDNYDDEERALLKEFHDRAKAARVAAEEAAKEEAQFAERIRRAAEERARREERARAEEAARLAAEERAREEEAARLAAEETARLAAEEAARALEEKEEKARLRREKAAQRAAEEADRLAAEEAARALEEKLQLAAKEKAKEKAKEVRAAADPKAHTGTVRQEPRPAHPPNRNRQAAVATNILKGRRMHEFDSKGVEANNELGYGSEGGLSDDVIMEDAETTHDKKGKKPLKRRLEADEGTPGRNKKPKKNTSRELEPEGGVFPPCDLCRETQRECTGRTRNTACDSCQFSKKACRVDGVSIRIQRSAKPAANSVVAVEEGLKATVSEGYQVEEGQEVVALARNNLELAKTVKGLEGLILGLYNAAVNDEELLPVLSEYMTTRQQDDREKAEQTDDYESLN